MITRVSVSLLLVTGLFLASCAGLHPETAPSREDRQSRRLLRSVVFVGQDPETKQLLRELNQNWRLSSEYEIEKLELEHAQMEWLHTNGRTPEKAILHLHGGAYRFDLNHYGSQYRRVAHQYAEISGAGVLTLDYRVAPPDPYPAALEDAAAAYAWLLDRGYAGEDIIIAGDSAGGGLALALTLYVRDNGMALPAGLVTMSAWTNLDYSRLKIPYLGKSGRGDDPYISPVYSDYAGFPPMLMQVGTQDITSDTLHVAEKAEKAGAAVNATVYEGMPHVFQAVFPVWDEANTAWDEAGDFIRAVFGS